MSKKIQEARLKGTFQISDEEVQRLSLASDYIAILSKKSKKIRASQGEALETLSAMMCQNGTSMPIICGAMQTAIGQKYLIKSIEDAMSTEKTRGKK